MTEPYDPNRWNQGYGQPDYQSTSQHPTWEQQQGYNQPSYQPTSQQQAWPQPQQQHDYGQQQGWPQQQAWNTPAPYGPPPQPSKGRGRLVAASAAVVVLAGGGVATYAAVSSSSASGGASSPRAAIEKIVTDINNNDLVGVLDDLPPAERSAITKPFLDTVDQLKRTQVLRSDADLHKVNGASVTATNLTFADRTVTINDHVQVVQVTGGSVHVTADAAQLPFTSQFLKLASPDSLQGSTVDQTVDIGKKVRSSGQPLRVAAQKVDGRWYPSLLYTVADNAVTSEHLSNPTSSIPANGASSADAAVSQFVEALLQGRVERAIELTSPDELAVLHDYGSVVVDKLHYGAVPATITNLTFTDRSISGGTRVSLKQLDLSVQGQTVSIIIDGDCVAATANGQSKRFCGSNIGDFLSGTGMQLTPEQSAALSRAFSGVSKIGLDASPSGGKWYVNPVRSYFDLSATVLAGLQDSDLLTIIGIFRDR